jgi:uncharacterized protein YcfL
MNFIKLFCVVFVLFQVVACSLPPSQPVTRRELMKTHIYSKYIVDESPEELLYSLNTRGEVVVESKRNIPGKDFPIFLKLLATDDGVIVLEYDR